MKTEEDGNPVLPREFVEKAVHQNRKNLGLPPEKDAVIGRGTAMFEDCHDHGRHAFEAYCAVYRNHGDHLVIAAPTLDALAKAWESFAPVPLDRDAAQHVFIIASKGVLPRPTKGKLIEGRDPEAPSS